MDVGFWGGAVPGNIGELTMLHEAGDTALAVLLNGQPVKGQPAGHEQP